MTITTQFLSQCTDEQINKGVAWIDTKKFPSIARHMQIVEIMTRSFDGGHFPADNSIPRYCTNPNDIMPIAFANRIGLIPDPIGTSWSASNDDLIITGEFPSYRFDLENKNPLRAICEVYILMSVSK